MPLWHLIDAVTRSVGASLRLPYILPFGYGISTQRANEQQTSRFCGVLIRF